MAADDDTQLPDGQRRGTPRVAIHLPLELGFADAGVSVEAEAANISLGGVYVRTPYPLDVGAELELQIRFGDQEDGGYPAIARVVRQQTDCDPVGYGLRFVHLSDELAELIDRLVADQERLGNYQLEALIGRGGMAEVYRAQVTDGLDLGRVVALKRMLPGLADDPTFIDLFVSEADITRQLRHPGIVEVIETGSVGDTFYIAMEYMDGGTLRDLIARSRERERQIPVPVACHIARSVAQALDYAHNARTPNGEPLGIIHCDVNPSNVLVSRDGEVKLSDFGVVFVGALRSERALAGKPNYRAPEQILTKPLSPAADVFGLGATLFELLTGQRAFDGTDADRVHKAILSGRRTPPSSVRRDVTSLIDPVVLNALKRRIQGGDGGLLRRGPVTDGRYPDAATLARALKPLCPDADTGRASLAAYLRELD